MWLTALVSMAFFIGDPGSTAPASPLETRVTHHEVVNDGVRLHYVALGEGPLVVMLHGFPDYWYTWRHQMDAIAKDHRVVAIDLRGYNRSDAPKGVAAYTMPVLLTDVAAVIRAESREKAIIVGHDWGGAIAWWFAMTRPAMTDRLIILNLPHPNGLTRELRDNPDQQANSAYARRFQEPDAHESLTAAGLASWVTDDAARARYIEAFERSDFEAMLNYYKANFPRTPAGAPNDATPPPPPPPPAPRVTMPVLMFHGLDDKALLASGLNDTWNWIDADLTLVTIPEAGHFVQQDASDLVTRTIVAWLHR